MTIDLTEAAVAGYKGEPLPTGATYSSPMHCAHALGEWFREAGKAEPRDVRMGRGYSIRANGMRFRIDGVRCLSFTRVTESAEPACSTRP